ncbi:MAG: NAD-dependent ligase adenylation domain, partial [Actinomycetota bacterium]
MDRAQAQAAIEALIDEINQHRRAYYEGNTVLVSDQVYDDLMHKL